VSAMRRDNDVLVICDDGSVWSKRPTGWVQESAIPGSEVGQEPGSGSGTMGNEGERGEIA